MSAPEAHNAEVLTLRAALAANRDDPADATPALTVGVACGFTPLHLETFVRAYVRRCRPGRAVRTVSGIYGDLAAAARDMLGHDLDAVVVAVEWSDLDPRLSPRRVDAAAGLTSEDVLATVRQRLASLGPTVRRLAARCPVAVVLPGLTLPVTLVPRTGVLGPVEAQLRLAVAGFAAELAGHDRVSVVDPPTSERDLRGELSSDLPHPVPAISGVARLAVAALFPPVPKKGLITDLDDTLWRGLVGEVGPAGVRWDLDGGAGTHALYQHLLATLAARGVLLAVVSKNDAGPVTAALARSDLRVPAGSLHPVLASWDAKSAAVTAVLRAWNVAADDVVVVDDNPTELAEISARHPAITALRFPTADAAAAGALLAQLRDLFARDAVGDDDRLRAASLRAGAAFAAEQGESGDELGFLRSLEGTITLDVVAPGDQRPYELAQKTNQFNLNGARCDPAAWDRMVAESGRTTVRASYRDRFGDLGTISVLSGALAGDTFEVDCWVLSCRAFSRGVEHQVLHQIATGLGARRSRLAYLATDRNAVMRRFLDAAGEQTDSGWTVDQQRLHDTGFVGVHHVIDDVRAGTRAGDNDTGGER